MNVVSKVALNELLSSKTIPCISLFMPAHRAGKDTEQDVIRFKNLLRDAELHLVDIGIRSPEAKKILEPAAAFLNDTLFWKTQLDGLAVFIAPGFFRYYRLPMYFEERVFVSDNFHITPLLPLFMTDGRFYILALNKKKIQLFRCTHLTMKEVELINVPTNIEDLLKYNVPEQDLQLHSAGIHATSGGGTIFHGVGADDSVQKKDILEFFQQINKNLMKIMNGDKAPMVLAGVDYQRALYKEINSYPHLVGEGIAGSPEQMTLDDLHTRAWEILEPYFQKAFQDAVTQYRRAMNSRLASQDLKEIVQAACTGRVEVLFVTNRLDQWGKVDTATGKTELHKKERPGDNNLQDFAAIQTLSKGGAVYVVEPRDAPVRSPLAALFRY